MLTYTTVQHAFRKEKNLSLNEYVFLDMVFYLSSNTSKVPGWCFASRETLAEEIGITKQGILNLIDRLEKKGLLVKCKDTKYLQTTQDWQQVYFIDGKVSLPETGKNGKESLPVPVKKVYQGGKESLPDAGKESLPYNNKLDNNTYNKKKKIKKKIATDVAQKPKELYDRKVDFLKALIDYQETHQTKYPKQMIYQFGRWWGEVGAKKKKMKWEMEDTFEIPLRLATWWEKTRDDEAAKFWEVNNTFNLRSKFNDIVKALKDGYDTNKKAETVTK